MLMMTGDNRQWKKDANRRIASDRWNSRSGPASAIAWQETRRWMRVWSFGCLMAAILTSGTIWAGTGAQADTLAPPARRIPNDVPMSASSKEALIRRLWSSRVSAPDPDADIQDRLALLQMVRRVQSVKFESRQSAPTFVPPAEPEAPAGRTPAKPAIAENTALDEPATVLPGPEESSTPLTATATRTLDDLLLNPDQVHDPFEMAELLFLSGRRAEAAPFYDRALALTSAAEDATSADRAWILFQLANCLRETDLIRAKDTYVTLIAEYPASPWAEIAKAHGQLITWYQKTKPHQLIALQEP